MSSTKRQRLSLTKKMVNRKSSTDCPAAQTNSHTITALFKLQQSSTDIPNGQHDSNNSCLNMSAEVGANTNNKVSRSSLLNASGCSPVISVDLAKQRPLTVNSRSSDVCLTDGDHDSHSSGDLPFPCISENSASDVHVATTNLYLSADDANTVDPSKDNSFAVNTDADGLNVDRSSGNVPYYLESFLLVINTVLNDSFYWDLFNDDDLIPVGLFRSLSEEAQMLYVRLFLRKHRWIREEKIIYKDIASNLSDHLNCLCVSSLVLDESKLDSVEEVIDCLPAPSLKSLAKTLHINYVSVKKQDLSSAIINHSKQRNMCSFFSGSSNATEKMVLKRAKALLGRCYRLDANSRAVFTRMMMLFGLHNSISDDQNSGQQQVFQMLMTRIGRIKYPEYSILRQSKIFTDRSSLMRFTEAIGLEADLCYEVEQKDYDTAYQLYMNVKADAERLLTETTFVMHDNSLPQHLRCFTAGAVFARILTYGVEVLQFTKRYSEAVDQLRWLLKQSVYHVDYRGRWYDRLALNLDYHLKQPLEALEIIKSSLCDKWVRAGRRYNLFLRAKKICQSGIFKKSKTTDVLWNDFERDIMNSVKDPIAVNITGRLVPHNIPGSTPMYVSPESCRQAEEDVTVFTRVEDVALRHYMDHGYPEGIHAEGSSVRSLFVLLMWDILFMTGIADVFYNPFQTFPLDLHTDNFYSSRREVIEKRLEDISNSNNEALCDMAAKVWDLHVGTLCHGMNWELFHNRDHVMGLIKCIGGSAMAGIFRRLAELNRYVTGGFPDLTVWNPDAGKFKIVEVKGPGDRLSTKQILWLNYLTELGVDAEVCYVKAISARKM